MCFFSERKIPAAIIGVLSTVVLLLSLLMIYLSLRFNSGVGGLEYKLGNMGEGIGDYANVAFVALLIASIVALMSSICGILTCCKANRCIAFVFGCTLLPATLTLLTFGMILSTVSHTSEEDLTEFCAQNADDAVVTEGGDSKQE